MKRMKILSLLMLFSGIFLLTGCRSSQLPDGPELERIAQWNKNPVYTEDLEDSLAEWLASDTPVSIVHTPENRWQNGLAECMDPFMVNWSASNIHGAISNQFVIIQNVQVGGNPLLGISRHATIKVPARGIERVELVIVRYRLDGIAGKVSGHVQLRFVFKEDRRPRLFNKEGHPDPEQPFLDDLIVSWEAWRPTNTPWQFIAGLEDHRYALTARMYSGAQRFLNDSLRGAVWDCYPINLPDDPDAADSILWSGLIMGDSLARRTIVDLLHEIPEADLQKIGAKWKKEQEEQNLDRLLWDEIPDDLLKDFMQDANLSYNSIARSCISIALLQIELAMQNYYKKKKLGSREEIVFVPQDIPRWFSDVVSGKPRSKLKETREALKALSWSRRHKQVFPPKAYLPLEKAGMLQTNKLGKIIKYRYSHKQASPYGALRRNLM